MRKNIRHIEPPTLEQITLVEDICNSLNITNFPHNSSQYSYYTYQKFIDSFIDEYGYALAEEAGRDMENMFYC